MKLILKDYMYNTVYLETEAEHYPTKEDRDQLKKTVARNEGIDASMIIIREVK